MDFIRFKTSLLSEEAENDPSHRSEFIHSIVQSIAVISDAIKRQEYIKDTSQHLNVEEEIIAREIKNILQGNQSTTTPQYPEKSISADDDFNKNMQNLLRLLVRYGERALFEDPNLGIVSVGQYVLQNLTEDQIEPRSPLHRLVLEEFTAHYQEPDFVAESFFLHHPNPEIGAFAVQMVEDKYPLSRIFQKKFISENVEQKINLPSDADILPELTSRLLLELKYTVVSERLDALQISLKQANADNDWETIRHLLEVQPQLIALRAQLCQALGNRVIV